MNKYYQTLDKILQTGKIQTNRKGRIKYLLNERLMLTPADLLDIFESHGIARKKLKEELKLFMQGVRDVEKYKEAGITWWDYCGHTLVNSYPTYFEKLPPLITRINREKRNSKNYVLFLGETGVESNQAPCLSLVQFQIDEGELVLSAYQRSSDANLGLPADIYHLYLMARQVELPLQSITLDLGNVHIYENNINRTMELLSGVERMTKMNLSAPLPFVGQKRMFAKEFIKVLEQFPEDTVFVDLFGGSGLLSHIAKRSKPDATVVYNDFDNYRFRLKNIPQTNKLLADIRELVGNSIPKHKPIKGELRERIFKRIEEEELNVGYVDFITLSSSLMFSMKYKLSVAEMRKEVLYNNIRKTGYPESSDYLKGLEIVSCDYKAVFNQYKDVPGVVFLIDPPYLSTDVGTYNMYWRLSDYLDVLKILEKHSFVYFTSNKSSILELCEWIGANKTIGNPFEGCTKKEFNAHMNYSAEYTDMMLYKKQEKLVHKTAA